MLKNGYIKLYRSLLEHWLCQDKPFCRFGAWAYLLLKAQIQDNKINYKGEIITLRRGTVNQSITSLADEWGWGREKVKRFLDELKSDGMIDYNATTHRTTITLLNYEVYQVSPSTNRATNRQQTIQPTDSKPTADRTQNKKNKEEYKKNKEEREGKLTLGYNKNIFLSETELAELKSLYPKTAMQKIERLSTYLVTSGRKYKSHFAVIKGWCEEDKDKDEAKTKTDKSKEKQTASYNLSEFETMALMSTPKGSEKD